MDIYARVHELLQKGNIFCLAAPLSTAIRAQPGCSMEKYNKPFNRRHRCQQKRIE
jgi:hypothetical protein